MAIKIEKQCSRSGTAFIASGYAAKYCGICDECIAAANGETTPRRSTKAKKASIARKAKRVKTGFRRETPVSHSANGGGLSTVVAQLQAELEAIDARRARVAALLLDATDLANEAA